jgi:DNA polymerase-3 subunit beta
MEFTCSREALSKGINVVQRAVANRGPLPILSNVLLRTVEESLMITATDLDVGIEVRVPARVQIEGSVAIAARDLSDIIGKLPNSDVALTVGEAQKATLNCARSRFVLPVQNPEEFPQLPRADADATLLQIEASELVRGIRQTAFAAAKDDKSIISGMLVSLQDGRMEVVATDGYRLAWRTWETPATGSFRVIVAARTMNEVARLVSGSEAEQLTLALARNQVLVTLGDRYMTLRTIDGNFPQYRQIIPASFVHEILLDRALLQEAVERITIMASEREGKVVNLRFEAGQLVLQAQTTDRGEAEESLPIDHEGESIGIAFNGGFLLDALKALEGETVRFQLSGPLQPACIESLEDPTYHCLLMPIRS